MVDPKIIARIEKLVQLAGSSNENEARNAAHLACKLIREHKVKIGGESEEVPRITLEDINIDPGANARVHVTYNDLEDLFADMFGEEQVNAARARAGRQAVNGEAESRYREARDSVDDFIRASQRYADGGVPTDKAKPKKGRPLRTKGGAMLIEAKFRGTCRDCGNRIDPGDKVWWKQGSNGAVHEQCDPSELT